jgi:F-box/leucine-rich repeat protein 14
LADCPKLTAACTRDMHKLTALTHVRFSGCKGFNDTFAQEIASRLVNLTNLSLQKCENLTDAGVQPLSTLRNLKSLDLSMNEQITETSLRHLVALQNLENLWSFGCQPINEWTTLRDLAKMRMMKWLWVAGAEGLTGMAKKIEQLFEVEIIFM